jgi:hypothetical protein
VRLVSGKLECTWCGAALDGVPSDAHVRIELAQASGAPQYRVIRLDGEEIHRCERPAERN